MASAVDVVVDEGEADDGLGEGHEDGGRGLEAGKGRPNRGVRSTSFGQPLAASLTTVAAACEWDLVGQTGAAPDPIMRAGMSQPPTSA